MPIAVLLAAALAATSSADYEALTAYDTVDLAPGIRGYFPQRTDTPMVSGNSIAIAGDDAVLVVDSGHFPAATRRMIADIRAWAGPKKPVRYLVNTHWHPDHN